MPSSAVNQNGLPSPPQTVHSAGSTPHRVVLAGKTGRILCVADIRGDYHELNRLIREHEATAVIHTGDFGFITSESLDRMSDKILGHLLQYSPLIPEATRATLLSIPAAAGRATLISALNNSSIHFPLSQFPHLLSGAITFPVPVFTVWGLIEDVQVLERFRTGEYEVNNLSVIDEATTRVIDVGGIRLRLFGLGGGVVPHKMFDNGEGFGTIAGGGGTMWTTALQIGELVATAKSVEDSSETRLFIASAAVSRNGLLTQLAHALKADLTISGGLHFRYPASFNEFSVEGEFELYRQKLIQARDNFRGVYEQVKDRVDSSMDEEQLALLKMAMTVTQRIPTIDDGAWTNTWHWVLTDASCGHLLLSITSGRVSAETRSSGLNFGHRTGQAPTPYFAPVAASALPTAKPVAPLAPRAAPVTPSPAGLPIKASTGPALPAAGPGYRAGHGRIAPTQPPKGPTSTGASTSAPPVAPTSSAVSSTQTTTAAKPQSTQPARAPRGPVALAGQPLAAASAAKPPVKAVDSKSAPPAKPVQTQKESKDRPSSAAGTKTATNSKSTPVPAAPANADKSSSKIQSEEKNTPAAAPAANSEGKENKTVNAGSAPTGRDVDADEEIETPPAPKRWSLYVKSLPIPTTEEELKKSFAVSSEKITSVKIPWDHFNKKPRDFAYVEFANEADMQQALKDNIGIIGEKTIHVSISNPPRENGHLSGGRGSRGRGGIRGGRGMRGGFVAGGSREGNTVNVKKEVTDAKTGGEKKESGASGGNEK